MGVEEKLRSKRLYKIELLLLKLIPMILAFTALLNSILSCEYLRLFLHYVVITWIINIIDYYIGIPITDLEYLCLQMIVAGISLFIILYLYVKHNKRAST